MNYHCLQKNCFRKGDYQIIAIRPEDIDNIRLWRNAQLEVLRQNTLLTYEDQCAYFQKNVWPTFQQDHPSQILFSLLLHDTCIGYGGLTRLDWEYKRGEISFLVDPLRAGDEILYRQDFAHFLALICEVAFDCMHLHRLVSETYIFRHSTLEVLEQVGFQREGVLREHVFKNGNWVDSILLALLNRDWHSQNERNKRLAVLITSISKKMPLIQAVRGATHKLQQFQDIHGCDSNSSCVGQYGVDKFWNSPLLSKLTANEVIAYCQANRIQAIIPTRDSDLEFYAQHLQLFHQQGIYPMVSPLKTIVSCLDKKKFADLLTEGSFPIIPTYLSLEEFDANFYVVKERKGAGSHALGVCLNRQDALNHSQQMNAPLFQPFIKGQEWSVDLYRTLEGKVKGCVARQRNVVVNGESQVTTTACYSDLEQLCQEMANFLGIYGHAVFQLIEDEKGNFHVIECNPRFGGASTASVAVGLESFLWFFMECVGKNLDDYPFMRSKKEIRQVRYPTDKVLPWSSFLT